MPDVGIRSPKGCHSEGAKRPWESPSGFRTLAGDCQEVNCRKAAREATLGCTSNIGHWFAMTAGTDCLASVRTGSQ